MSVRTCRFCNGDIWIHREPYLKYGTRHYAHPRCYILCKKDISTLSDHQLGELPYFLLKETGLLEYVEKRLAKT